MTVRNEGANDLSDLKVRDILPDDVVLPRI
ncbi:MAG: hypothetical protein LC751_09350 [Actinobacteria bacterium]|nr:hypothetical protein [Actinomycetota bacterium]MCA1738352.1 hypothetical protein [Actinomycetota bacterium]